MLRKLNRAIKIYITIQNQFAHFTKMTRTSKILIMIIHLKKIKLQMKCVCGKHFNVTTYVFHNLFFF